MVSRRANRRRQKKNPLPLHPLKRPPEIEKLRCEAAIAARKKFKSGERMPLPPGVEPTIISIPVLNAATQQAGTDNTETADETVNSEPEPQPLAVTPEPEPQAADVKPENQPDEDDDSVEDDYAPCYPLSTGEKMINIKPANLWLAEQALVPAPKKLFGNLWLQGELCLLYADTNMGKSLLAVQIGDSISRGTTIAPFEMDAEPSALLYLDFELSAKQFELRYRDAGNAHEFSPEFYRAEFNLQKDMPERYETFEDYMQDTLEWAIRNTLPQVLIIDNITCLSEGSHQAAGTAVALMKALKQLQDKNKLSILVLAHTPKRNAHKPISRDDMGGSKMLMNFADSAFAIGQSHADSSLRYLKQIKQRSGSQQYGADNICLMKLVRQDGFLKYEFYGNGYEDEHLRRNNFPQRAQTAACVLQLQQQGLSQRQIAARLSISVSTVNIMLKEQMGVDGGVSKDQVVA